MISDIWFSIPYRDRSYKKYQIEVSRLDSKPGGRQAYLIYITIWYEENSVSELKISFSDIWVLNTVGENKDNFKKYLGTNEYSALISNFVHDYVFDKDLASLNGVEISFDTNSEHIKSVSKNKNGMLNYLRDPIIVAKENRFARELALKELYFIFSSEGPCQQSQLVSRCNFNHLAIVNAISVLTDRGFIVNRAGLLRLSHAGASFIEDELLSQFSGKVFLIAACRDDIFDITDKVYKPAVKDLGYDLIFQEKSEPKNTIHDDIWDNIKNCRVILCDLTYERPNCFIEYGFALAFKKHIILCVDEGKGKTKGGRLKVPFDTQTQKYSFWRKEWLSNPDKHKNELDEFREEIKERLRRKIQIIESELNI